MEYLKIYILNRKVFLPVQMDFWLNFLLSLLFDNSINTCCIYLTYLDKIKFEPTLLHNNMKIHESK